MPRLPFVPEEAIFKWGGSLCLANVLRAYFSKLGNFTPVHRPNFIGSCLDSHLCGDKAPKMCRHVCFHHTSGGCIECLLLSFINFWIQSKMRVTAFWKQTLSKHFHL